MTVPSRNALEQQLYSSSIDDLKRECSLTNIEYNYEKGMFFSLNNYQQTWEQLASQFAGQYQSIVKSITGKTVHPGFIRQSVGRIPSNLLDIIASRKLFLVACIHDYHPNDRLGRGRSTNQDYKHTHFYVYGAHHYLPSSLGMDYLKDQEEKLKRYIGFRYLNRKKKSLWRDNAVSVGAVGVGKYRYTDKVSPTRLRQYLNDGSGVINYMRGNRHRPEVQYPLYFLWEN